MYIVLVTRDFFYKYPFKTSGNSGLCDSFYEIRKMSTGQKKTYELANILMHILVLSSTQVLRICGRKSLFLRTVHKSAKH